MSKLEPTNEASAMQKEISAIAEQGGGRATKVEQLIQQYCPDGVEYKKLEDCCQILDNKRKPITKGARVAGEYPYYGANGVQDYVANYIFDGKYVLVGEDGSVITPSGTPVVNWAEGKIWVNNHAHIISEKKGVLLRYLFHYLQTINITPLIHGNIPKLTGGDFRALTIPVPPLPVQEEIVRILDTLTELQAELQAELQKRLQQYNYYRDNILSFEGRTDIEWKKLGEITTILRGKRLIKSQLSNDKPYAVYHGGLEPLGYYESANRTANTTMIINVGASAGTIGYSKEDFWSSDGCYCVEHSNLFDDRYIYYVLQTQEQQLKSKVRVAGIPTLDRPVVEDLLVPIPPLAAQQRIVNILDRFDKLTTDITAGLPAEIEARRKQYEYYRDQLLTFKQKA